MSGKPVDLNAQRKLRAGREDDGRCPECGRYRIICRLYNECSAGGGSR